METKRMLAILREAAENSGETGQTLLTPALGLFRGQLRDRSGVVPEQEIGTLVILDRILPVFAPAGTQGRVARCFLEPGLHPVEYGQPLYRLEPMAEEASGGKSAATDPARLTERQLAVRSPTDGVFYRRPDPQSPAYVEVGDVVEPGHTLGLVEVMKCFNQVRFDGQELPGRARVAAIPIEDTAEIQYGQVLFVLEPAE